MWRWLISLLATSAFGASSVNSPCYWSGQLVKCLPTTGIYLENSRTLRLGTDNRTNYIELAAPASVNPNYTIYFPSTSGHIGDLLYNIDGSGVLGWTSPGVTQNTVNSTIALTHARRMADLVCLDDIMPTGIKTCDGQSTTSASIVLLVGEASQDANGLYFTNDFGDWTQFTNPGAMDAGIFTINQAAGGTDYSDTVWLGHGDGGEFNNGAWIIPTTGDKVNLTSSRAVVTDSNHHLASAATTAAEIGYVSGVSSAIQTQLDAKATSSSLVSSVYTGSVTSSTNTDSSVTVTQAQYSRNGSVVTVSGRFTADPTLTTTTTSFELSLPVASNLGAAEDLAGVAFCGAIAAMGAEVTGVSANDTAKVVWKSTDITSQTWSYTFTYRVL